MDYIQSLQIQLSAFNSSNIMECIQFFKYNGVHIILQIQWSAYNSSNIIALYLNLMQLSRVETLKSENALIQSRIQQFKNQRSNSSNLKQEIIRFVQESKKNLEEMTAKVVQDNNKRNQQLHQATITYENVLKKQIELLTENKHLSEKKENQDRLFNENIEKVTGQYESQIKQFENKVKENVKRIQELSGSNVINRLLKNNRFRERMQARGCSLEALESQSKLEEVSLEVEAREKEIAEVEEKSAQLDEELVKMHELIDTMKDLMENMMKEKENIMKQNLILKEKLKQSEELIAKLLGAAGQQGEQDEEGQEEDQEEEDEEQENEEKEKDC